MINLLRHDFITVPSYLLFYNHWWDPKYGNMFGMWQDPLDMCLMGRLTYDRDD